MTDYDMFIGVFCIDLEGMHGILLFMFSFYPANLVVEGTQSSFMEH